MIELRDITKEHGGRNVVDGVSFTVAAGRVTGFLGPNGAGKSTTIRMMLGLERPTSGTVRIDGVPYGSLREPLRKVGALLNASWTNRSHSGRAHLRWIAASNGIPDRRVDEVLELVGLGEAAGKRTGAYSLGMLQRLGMANALLGDPEYLLLDEPGNGLDPEGIVWLRELVLQLAGEGRGVLISSHLLAEIALVADDLVVIARGRAMAKTTVAEFVGAHATLEQAFVAAVSDQTDHRARRVATGPTGEA
jgi:ABC-2 type transport system ATP-binding protein